jgi:hypothetical protein
MEEQMSEQEASTMEDLTGLVQDGILGNPSADALMTGEYVKDNGPFELTVHGFIKRKFTDRKTGKEETAWVMKFAEDVPGVKLNATRQSQLFEIMQTAQIDQIVSRKIIVAYDPTIQFGGRKVGGIRLERAEDLAAQ